MTQNENIRVLLVDDHEVVRAGYCRLLESTDDIEVAAEAGDGESAYLSFVAVQPTVVIMDLNMPGGGGLDACRRILAREPGARILVFSVHENEIFLQRALELGVLGYISKRSASRVMLDAVRIVAAGQTFVGEEMKPYLAAHESAGEKAIRELTPREFEVFRLLAEGHSVNEIAGILNVSPKTAGHHYTHLKQKLGIANPAELTRLAIRMGITTP